MTKIISKGSVVEVRMINPADIQKMNENDYLIVNRIRLNSKIVECEIRKNNPSSVDIILKAIKSMKEQESRSRRTVMGAKMRVGDIKTIFPDFKGLPKNSFALVDE